MARSVGLKQLCVVDVTNKRVVFCSYSKHMATKLAQAHTRAEGRKFSVMSMVRARKFTSKKRGLGCGCGG